jgi:hypothetical protein
VRVQEREQVEKNRSQIFDLEALAIPTLDSGSDSRGVDEGDEEDGAVGLGLNDDDFAYNWKSPRSVLSSPPSPVTTEVDMSAGPTLKSILKRTTDNAAEFSNAAPFNAGGYETCYVEKKLTGHSPRPVKPSSVAVQLSPRVTANANTDTSVDPSESNAGCTPPPSLPSSAASSPVRIATPFSPRPHRQDEPSDSEPLGGTTSSSSSSSGIRSRPAAARPDAYGHDEELDDSTSDDADLSELSIMPAITRTDSLHCVKSVPRGPPVIPPDDPTIEDCGGVGVSVDVNRTFGNGLRALQSSSNMAKRSEETSCGDGDGDARGSKAAGGEMDVDGRMRSSSSVDDTNSDSLTLCVPLDRPAKLRPEGQRRALASTRTFLSSSLGLVVGILVWLAILGVILAVLIEKRSAAQMRAGAGTGAPMQAMFKAVLSPPWAQHDVANSNSARENSGSGGTATARNDL